MEGACVTIIRHCSSDKSYIVLFSLIASLGKCAFRIQNLYLLIVVHIENGVAVTAVENSDIPFHYSSHFGQQVSNLLTVTGGAGKVFIRY